MTGKRQHRESLPWRCKANRNIATDRIVCYNTGWFFRKKVPAGAGEAKSFKIQWSEYEEIF